MLACGTLNHIKVLAYFCVHVLEPCTRTRNPITVNLHSTKCGRGYVKVAFISSVLPTTVNSTFPLVVLLAVQLSRPPLDGPKDAKRLRPESCWAVQITLSKSLGGQRLAKRTIQLCSA